jgi:hypothetical protein
MTPYHKRSPSKKLKKYTFQGVGAYSRRSVYADSEEEARDLAMRTRWGPPGDAVVPYETYKGLGLELVSADEIAQ